MNKNMKYLDRVAETCIAANAKSMKQVGGWDNKKRKTAKQYMPRGKAYKRVARMEDLAFWNASKSFLSDANLKAIELLEKAGK